jgi:hypothetical protein
LPITPNLPVALSRTITFDGELVMAVTRTTRFSLHRWDSGADSFNREQNDTDNRQVEALAALFRTGLDAQKGSADAAEYARSFYYASDTSLLYFSDGTNWVTLNSYSTGADIENLPVGSSNSAGSVNAASGVKDIKFALHDHVHGTPASATPVAIGTTLSAGNVLTTTVALSDHVHVIGTGAITAASQFFGTPVDASVIASGAVSAATVTVSNLVTTANLTVTGSFTSPTITSGSFTGQATLTGVSTAPTGDANTSNTQIATTGWVKNVLNSGNTFNLYASTLNPYTLVMNQNVNTANSVQFNSIGIGTGPSGTTGEIRATNNITAYYSDDRLKTKLGNIENALSKIMSLNGFHYEANETAQALGYAVKPEVGLSAQEVQAVLPEVVVPAPIDEKYLTIHYERVIPLLVEAIKELKREIDSLKK